MARVREITITKVIRLRNSNLGNPRWHIDVEGGGYFRTAQNSTVGYSISTDMTGKSYTVELNGHNYITEITPIPGSTTDTAKETDNV